MLPHPRPSLLRLGDVLGARRVVRRQFLRGGSFRYCCSGADAEFGDLVFSLDVHGDHLRARDSPNCLVPSTCESATQRMVMGSR